MDVFDGSYPYSASEQGCALTFFHQLPAQRKMEGEEKEEEKGGREGAPQSCVISLKEDRYSSRMLCHLLQVFAMTPVTTQTPDPLHLLRRKCANMFIWHSNSTHTAITPG